jgi:hypothetical protein
MKEGKLVALRDALTAKLKEKNADLAEFRKKDSGVPAVGSAAISVASAAVAGYVDGVVTGDRPQPTHPISIALAGLGGVTATVGALTGHPTLARVGLDVGLGPACGLAHAKSFKAGIDAKIARLAADAAKQVAQGQPAPAG